MESTKWPGIYRRGSVYVVVYRGPDRKQRKRSAPTLAAARALKASLQTDVRRGEYVEPSRERFDTYARAWVDARPDLRETTRANYRAAIEQRAIPYFNARGMHTLASITPARLKAWVRDLSLETRTTAGVEKPLARSTIANAVKPVRAMLRDAAEDGLLRQNPAAYLRLPRKLQGADDPEDVRHLTREELRALLAVIHPKHRTLFRLLAETGLRISEAVGLTWSHVDLNGSNPQVKVRQAIVKNNLHPPKSKYGRRDVPISPALVDALREARSSTEWPGDEAPVFPNETGGWLNEGTLRRRHLDPVMAEIGAPWAGFPSLRHTAASLMIARGDSPVQVQRRLGHHSPGFTLAVYVHLFPGEGARPLDLLDELEVATQVATNQTETDWKGLEAALEETG